MSFPDEVAGSGEFAADDTTLGRADGTPALRLPCLAGGRDVVLDDLGGRPVLVNLWASWSTPRRDEMPLLQAAYELPGDRIAFLGVDTQDSQAAVLSLLVDLGVTYAHVVDEDRALLTTLSLRGLPVTLAVAADGRIVVRQVGPASAARLEDLISGAATGADAS